MSITGSQNHRQEVVPRSHFNVHVPA